MRRDSATRTLGSAALETALALSAIGLLFGRGLYQVLLMMGCAAMGAWWAFKSEP
jgi:hypothetical protein